jgi:methyl-accepting chemotaxis protein
MDEVTQQNAALAEQTSAASASLNEKAKQMHELMSFFKASGSIATASPGPASARPLQPSAPVGKGTVDSIPAPQRPAVPKPTSVQAAAAGVRQVGPVVDDGDEWEEF